MERKKKTNLSPILPTETSLLVCLRDRFCFPPLLFESEASAFLAKFLLLYANYSALWFSLFLPPPSSLSFRDVTKVTCVILLKGARNRARRLKARRVLQGIDLKHFDYVRTRIRCNFGRNQVFYIRIYRKHRTISKIAVYVFVYFHIKSLFARGLCSNLRGGNYIELECAVNRILFQWFNYIELCQTHIHIYIHIHDIYIVIFCAVAYNI